MNNQLTRQETGVVVNSSMDKTISVLVERRVKHSLYKKILRRSTKLQAHDESNECQNGDVVRIGECRAISKNKSWKLIKIEKKNRSKDL